MYEMSQLSGAALIEMMCSRSRIRSAAKRALCVATTWVIWLPYLLKCAVTHAPWPSGRWYRGRPSAWMGNSQCTATGRMVRHELIAAQHEL